MDMSKNKLLLTRLATFLLIGLSILMVYQMSYRSVWLDEAMLLKNILNTQSFLDFVNPLPYYDQAEPFLASVFFKFTTDHISENFQSIRLFTALFLVISILPLLSIFRKNRLGQLVLFLVLFSTLVTVGFFFTEIKHYFLEIFASTFMVYAIYLYDKTNKLLTPVLILSISTLLGFSTLIPAIVILGYILLEEYKKRGTIFKKDILLLLGFYLLIILATYIQMKLLTVYQISNYRTYLSKGLSGDLTVLMTAIVYAYGKIFVLLASIASTYALFVNKKSFLFRLNIIFIVIISTVILAKLTGVYPVFSGRHLAWLLPFSIVILTLVILNLLEKGGLYKYVSYLLIMGLFLQSLNVVYKVYNNKLEDTANNALYEYVSKMDAGNIVLHYYSQAPFEYYSAIMPELKKHDYYGLWDSKSKQSDFIREYYISLPILNKEFYYLISHLGNINHSQIREINELKNKFKEKNCSYSSEFSDNRVQLLKVNCSQRGDNK